jgi:CMP-N,N'-diacetyllegionaminic acid synthase
MMYIFDIDGTICDSKGTDYENAVPDENMIKMINKLYDEEHTIVIMTGRGSVSGIDRKTLTLRQLKEWGVKYHQVKFIKKPREYLYVDDKCCSPDEFWNKI